MREFFAGRNAELLTEEAEMPGIRIWHMELEEKEFGHMACRLEESVTFLHMLRGTMTCQINQGKTELGAGEGIFINSRNAYRFTGCREGGCELYVMSINGEYLKTDEITAQNYVEPVIQDERLFALKLNPEKKEAGELLECLRNAGEAAKAKRTGYQLEIRSFALRMWLNLYKEVQAVTEVPKKAEIREKAKLYRMLEFLHMHYKEKITLGEMAEDCGVSTGEYCRFFKKRMERTPFEYLQAYRIEKSLPEVLEKSDSITNIALKHGFTGSSYYAETFKKEMGCAPGDYRKWFRGEVEGECPLKDLHQPEKEEAAEALQQESVQKETEKLMETPEEKAVKAAKAEEKPAEEKKVQKPVRRNSMPMHLL